jgi:hydrogenase-4 transcriptional activator
VAKALGVDAQTSHKAATGGRASGWGGSSTATPTEISSTAVATGIEPLNAAIRRHIEAALAIAHGRIEGRQGAAAMLKINPHTLRAKMRKLGIDWARFRESP